MKRSSYGEREMDEWLPCFRVFRLAGNREEEEERKGGGVGWHHVPRTCVLSGCRLGRSDGLRKGGQRDGPSP